MQVPAGDHELWRPVDRDEGVGAGPATEALAELTPLMPDAVHTTGTRAPAADGAAALLWASRRMARALGLRPRARIVAQAAVGTDPRQPLDGPVDATRAVLGKAGMSVRDLDLIEVDETFGAVVLSWALALGQDEGLDRVNVNGGALALGHPGGAAGARLLTTALHELERRDGTWRSSPWARPARSRPRRSCSGSRGRRHGGVRPEGRWQADPAARTPPRPSVPRSAPRAAPAAAHGRAR